MTWEASLDAELRRRSRLYLRCKNDDTTRANVLTLCRRDPLYWLDNFAWTIDTRIEGEDKQNLPLVAFTYQREVFKLFLGIGGPQYRDAGGDLWPLLIDKFRAAGLTEIITKAMVWGWLFDSGCNYGVMSRSENEVDDRIDDCLFGRVRTTIAALPAWMRPSGWRGEKPDRYLDRHMSARNPDNGNVIMGSSTSGSAFRSRRQRRVFYDEASMPHDGIMLPVMRSLQSVSRALCLVATPNGWNHFARMIHGEIVQTTRWGDPLPKYGWMHVRCTWDMDPRNTPEWFERTKILMTDEEFAQEINISYEASTPGRIWPEFSQDDHVYDWDQWDDVKRYLLRGVLYEAWDFGTGPSLTCVVWALEHKDAVYLLDYRGWSGATPDQIAKDVGEAGYYSSYNPQGRKPTHRIGDPAMMIRGAFQRTWQDHLAEHGIRLSWRHTESREDSIYRVRKAIINSAEAAADEDEALVAAGAQLHCAPACGRRHKPGIPTLVESMLHYRRRLTSRGAGVNTYSGRPDVAADKDKHSHMADCVQYLGDWIWPEVRPRQRPARWVV